MQTRRRITVALSAVLALGLMGAANARAVKGQFPPDFTAGTLDGKKLTLSDFRGRNPVVLNFFAEFCGPCRREFPHLKELDERHGPKGLRVIGVSLDDDRRSASVIPTEAKVKFPIVFDPKAGVAEKYAVQAIPHTVVLNRAGKVHAVIIGADLEALDRAVTEVMR